MLLWVVQYFKDNKGNVTRILNENFTLNIKTFKNYTEKVELRGLCCNGCWFDQSNFPPSSDVISWKFHEKLELQDLNHWTTLEFFKVFVIRKRTLTCR